MHDEWQNPEIRNVLLIAVEAKGLKVFCCWENEKAAGEPDS